MEYCICETYLQGAHENRDPGDLISLTFQKALEKRRTKPQWGIGICDRSLEDFLNHKCRLLGTELVAV